jgi:hypothetical protein
VVAFVLNAYAPSPQVAHGENLAPLNAPSGFLAALAQDNAPVNYFGAFL